MSDAVVKRWQRFVGEHHVECQRYHRKHAANSVLVDPNESSWPREVRDAMPRYAPTLELSSLHRVVQALSGRESTSRHRIRVKAHTPEREGFAQMLTRGIEQLRDNANAQHKDSLAFKACLIGGASCVQQHMNTYERGGPRLQIDRVPLREMIWDTNTYEPNFEDRAGSGRLRWIDLNQARRLIPDLTDAQWKQLLTRPDTQWNPQMGPVWSHLPGVGNGPGIWHDGKRRILMAEYEWKERREVVEVLVPPEIDRLWKDLRGTGQVTDSDAAILGGLLVRAAGAGAGGSKAIAVSPRQMNAIQAVYRQMTGQAFQNFYTAQEDAVHWAQIVGDQAVRKGERREGAYTTVFTTGFHSESRGHDHYYGVVDVLRDPHHLHNRFFSLMTHLISIMPKSTLIYDATAARDTHDEISRKWATPGGAIRFNGDISRVVKEVSGGRLPPEISYLFQYLESATPRGLGLDDNFLGTVGDLRRTSGSALSAVMAAQNTALSELFDSFSLSRRTLGRLAARQIAAFFGGQQLATLVGQELEMYVPADLSEISSSLDLVGVAEEPVTVDSSSEALQRLANLSQLLISMGAAPPAEAVINLFSRSVGANFGDTWMAHFRQQQQMAQAQQFPQQAGPQQQGQYPITGMLAA